MVKYFIGVNVINRTLHGYLEIRNFSSRIERNFSRLGNFQHSKRNFVSPRGLVISSIYGNRGMTVNFWTDQTFLLHNRPLWFQFIEHTQQNEVHALVDSFIQIAVYCYPLPRVGAFLHSNAETIYCLFP